MSDNRARIWFSLFVLAVFCLGGALGVVVGGHLPPPHQGAFFFGLHGGGPGRGGLPLGARGEFAPLPPPEMVRRMEDELQLDAAQREQVRKILDERRGRLEQIHRDARERFDREAGDLHSAIRAVLRPDQQQKFDRFLEQHRR